MQRHLLLTVSFILGAVLTGCAESSHDSAQAPNPALPTISEESGRDETNHDKVGETDPASCLHGTWVAENSFFLAAVQAFGDEIESVTGQVLLNFETDGTMTTQYQGWTITASAEGATVQVVREGIDTGSYSATEDTVTITDTSLGSTITMHGAGLHMVIDPEPVNYVDATYTCTPTQSSILTADGALELSRH